MKYRKLTLYSAILAITIITLWATGTIFAAKPPSGSEVTIINTAANPVIISDAYNPPSQPFQKSVNIWFNPQDPSNKNATFDVPMNKRLVIEFASSYCWNFQNLPPFTRVYIATNVSGSIGRYELPIIGTQNLRVYADPGTQVKVFVSIPGPVNSFAGFDVSISGYLVDIP